MITYKIIIAYSSSKYNYKNAENLEGMFEVIDTGKLNNFQKIKVN